MLLLPLRKSCVARTTAKFVARLVRRVARARLALRHRVEHADREAARESADQLRGAEDRRRLQRHGVAVDAGELRRAADAAAVVEVLRRCS